MIMFESKKQRLLPLSNFIRRMVICMTFAAGILSFALGLGVLGYHFIAGFAWVDAFLEASMILTGMGPVGQLHSSGAKVFAALYALFSGLIFLSCIAVTLAPVLHRILHRFHIDEADFEKER